MAPFLFITELLNKFPESCWSWLIPSLRQDIRLWNDLLGDFGEEALDDISGNPEDFTPASLCLFALKYPETAEDLRQEPLLPINDKFRSDANIQENLSYPAFLAQTGMGALKMRERRREAGSWESLTNEIKQLDATVLACLHDIISDPQELLFALTANADPIKVTDMIMRNPMPPDDHTELIVHMLDEASPTGQAAVFNHIHTKYPTLVSHIANRFGFETEINGDIRYPNIAQYIDQLDQYLQSTHIGSYRDQNDDQVSGLQSALKTIDDIKAQLASQAAQNVEDHDLDDECLEAWEIAYKINPTDKKISGSYSLALIGSERFDRAREILDGRSGDSLEQDIPPFAYSLASALLAKKSGDIQTAKSCALKAYQKLNATKDIPPKYFTALGNLFVDASLASEAVKTMEFGIRQYPNDQEIASYLSILYQRAGNIVQSQETAKLAVAINPGSLALRRILANNLDESGRWIAAMTERRTILDRQPDTPIDDLHALANTALRAKRPGESLAACQTALLINPDDGIAFAYLGEAHGEMDQPEKAIESANKAIQLLPDNPQVWISKAVLLCKFNQENKALETLRSGILSSPANPTLQYALAEMYITLGSKTQALAALRTAYDLCRQAELYDVDPGISRKINLQLAKTLLDLGHQDEAQRILQKGYQAFPEDPNIAYLLAKLYLGENKPYSAIGPLNTTLQTRPEDYQPYYDYASCLLSLGDELSDEQKRAVLSSLEYVLQKAPQHAEAKALFAEALFLNHKSSAAIDAYRQAIETGLAQDPKWAIRLNLGMGKVTRELGQIEASIAALREALQVDPNDSDVYRELSVSYEAAHLFEDAWQATMDARPDNHDDIEGAIWYAGRALDLHNQPGLDQDEIFDQALDVLNEALDIGPDRVDLLVQLTRVQLQRGEHEAALHTIKQVVECDISAAENELELPEIINNLRVGAELCLELGEPGYAVISLENILSLAHNFDEGNNLHSEFQNISAVDLLKDIARYQYLSGEIDQALDNINQAILLAPNDTSLYLEKAYLLVNRNEDEANGETEKSDIEARRIIEAAVEIDPANPGLNIFNAQIYRKLGDLTSAHKVIEQALYLFQDQDIGSNGLASVSVPLTYRSDANGNERGVNSLSLEIAARITAAEISAATLNFDQAQKFLLAAGPNDDTPLSLCVDYHCLNAELALEGADTHTAAKAYAAVAELDETHPRVLALQARMAAREPDHQLQYNLEDGIWTSPAVETLIDALRVIEDPTWQAAPDFIGYRFSSANTTRLAIAKACSELRMWDKALHHGRAVCVESQSEPLCHAFLAQTLLQRAEYQRFCHQAAVVTRAPGEHTRSMEIKREFENAVSAIEIGLRKVKSTINTQRKLKEYESIARQLSLRGEAVFNPTIKAAAGIAELPESVGDKIAQIYCLGEFGEILEAGNIGRSFPQHPFVLGQLALILEPHKPRQAFIAAQAALEALTNPDPPLSIDNAEDQAYLRAEDAPMLQAVLAKIMLNHAILVTNPTLAFYTILSAIDVWPDEPRWHVMAANLYLEQAALNDSQDISEAVKHLSAAVELDPADGSSLLELGRLYLEHCEREAALRTLEKACQILPDNHLAWYLFAKANKETGDYEKDASFVQRAHELMPESILPEILLCEIALSKGDLPDALNHVQTAIAIDPQDQDAIVLKSKVLVALGKSDEALGVISKAIDNSSDTLPFQIEKAHLYQQLEGIDRALLHLNGLINEHPDNPEVLTVMAGLLEEKGEVETAVQLTQQAIRGWSETSDHEPSPTVQAHTHLLLGRLLCKSGQLDQAIHHISQSVQLNPNQAEAYLELGQAYLSRRQPQEALHVYQQGIAAAPSNAQLYYLAGQLLKDNKEYIEAELLLRQASELAPDDVKIHRLLGAVVAINLVHNSRTIRPNV